MELYTQVMGFTEKQQEHKDKTRCAQVNNSKQQLLQKTRVGYKAQLLHIQDRVGTSAHTCVHNAHNNHTRLALLLEASWYNTSNK